MGAGAAWAFGAMNRAQRSQIMKAGKGAYDKIARKAGEWLR